MHFFTDRFLYVHSKQVSCPVHSKLVPSPVHRKQVFSPVHIKHVPSPVHSKHVPSPVHSKHVPCQGLDKSPSVLQPLNAVFAESLFQQDLYSSFRVLYYEAWGVLVMLGSWSPLEAPEGPWCPTRPLLYVQSGEKQKSSGAVSQVQVHCTVLAYLGAGGALHSEHLAVYLSYGASC